MNLDILVASGVTVSPYVHPVSSQVWPQVALWELDFGKQARLKLAGSHYDGSLQALTDTPLRAAHLAGGSLCMLWHYASVHHDPLLDPHYYNATFVLPNFCTNSNSFQECVRHVKLMYERPMHLISTLIDALD
jgi:hypothetical protein